MLPNIGTTELIVVLVLGLSLFGARCVPEPARSFGSGVREFRGGTTGDANQKSLLFGKVQNRATDDDDEHGR